MMQLFALLAVLAFGQLVSALTITSPNAGTPWIGNTTVQITWTSVAGDPSTFTVELARPNQNLGPYGGQLAVGNNVPTANGQLSFELPQVPPGGGYVLTFVNISDINIVYATSDTFSVTENDATSTTTSTTSTSGTVTSMSVSGSTTSASTGSSSSSSTSSSSTATPTSFSSAATSLVSSSWLRELITASTVLSAALALGAGLLA